MTQPPSTQDVQAMSELTSLMNDIETGAPLAPTVYNNTTSIPTDLLSVCATDVTGDASIMGNIMSALDDNDPSDVASKYSAPTQKPTFDTNYALPVDASEEDIYSLLVKDVQKPANMNIPDHPINYPKQNVPASKEYIVVSENFKGAKIQVYSIKNTHTNSIIAANLALRESAVALSNMLNESVPITNPKFVGVLSMGLQYSQLFESTFDKIQKRQVVLKECNYSAAQEMDEVIHSGKIKADSIKSDLMIFLTKEQIGYK